MQQTLDIMHDLHLSGMASEYRRQLDAPSLLGMDAEERIAMMVDAERVERETKKQVRMQQLAKLKVNASPEDIVYRSSRQLDRSVLAGLMSCDWIRRAQNVLITGPTGVGKTWLACALATQAMRRGFQPMYRRVPRLLEELEAAHADGTLGKLRTLLTKGRVLVLDDWAISPLSDRSRSDLLELLEDRVGVSSVIMTSQLPISCWHQYIADQTLADAILDRLLHSSHRLELQGESMRKLSKVSDGATP